MSSCISVGASSRNSITGHCRLLDADNRRHARGTFAECRDSLVAIKTQRGLPEMKGRVVILMHGLGRTRGTMEKLAASLEQLSGATVLNFGYASTCRDVGQHAQALASVMRRLGDGIDEVDFVAHSLGNIVIRRYLADTCKASGRQDPRVRRIVMIAPPNHGSLRAEAWSDNHIYKLVFGKTGQQLSPSNGWKDLEKTLVRPQCEFGVIAGGKNDGQGWKEYLPGDDDGTVTVSTTMLAGARDFLLVHARHSSIIDDPTTTSSVLRFIEKGYFLSQKQRRPILKLDAPKK